jgi:hypothetical protein
MKFKQIIEEIGATCAADVVGIPVAIKKKGKRGKDKHMFRRATKTLYKKI